MLQKDSLGRFVSTTNNIIGQEFGCLKVLEFSHKESNNMKNYKCQCLNCGRIFIKRITFLRKLTDNQGCSCLIKHQPKKKNKIIIEKDCVKIILESGDNVIIDIEDIDKVSKHYWAKGKNSRYATSYTFNENGIHNLIMGCKNVDHINRNTLDNRKSNLRICNHQENCQNRGLRCDNHSRITGVNKNTRGAGWICEIRKGKQRFSKYFPTKKQAILCRFSLEDYLFQEFAPQRSLYDKYNYSKEIQKQYLSLFNINI